MIELLHTIIAHFAVGSAHGSVELTRIAEFEFELSASEDDIEKLFALIICEILVGYFALLLALRVREAYFEMGQIARVREYC